MGVRISPLQQIKRVDQPGKGRVSLWFFYDEGMLSHSFLNYPNRASNSVGLECHSDTVVVVGSSPTLPTTNAPVYTSGPGSHPLKVKTRVRIPSGVQKKSKIFGDFKFFCYLCIEKSSLT